MTTTKIATVRFRLVDYTSPAYVPAGDPGAYFCADGLLGALGMPTHRCPASLLVLQLTSCGCCGGTSVEDTLSSDWVFIAGQEADLPKDSDPSP